jgi:hypothetical protein
LWQCPECQRQFANRNQTHTCSRHTIDHHFAGKPPDVRALFDAFVAMLREIGEVTILPEKTRIAFQVRMSFAAVSVRRNYLVGHFVLARRIDHPRFLRVESFSPRNHLHAFRVNSLTDLDAQFARWARESYAVGQQRHLDTVGPKANGTR